MRKRTGNTTARSTGVLLSLAVALVCIGGSSLFLYRYVRSQEFSPHNIGLFYAFWIGVSFSFARFAGDTASWICNVGVEQYCVVRLCRLLPSKLSKRLVTHEGVSARWNDCTKGGFLGLGGIVLIAAHTYKKEGYLDWSTIGAYPTTWAIIAVIGILLVLALYELVGYFVSYAHWKEGPKGVKVQNSD